MVRRLQEDSYQRKGKREEQEETGREEQEKEIILIFNSKKLRKG